MITVLDSLNAGLQRAMTADKRVYLLGEDILDPYGGAFKVTRGLSTAYPDRVLTTPISEAGIVGLATGMALRGLRPVVEIMFGDFLTLAADQLINHVTKFNWMYNGGKSLEEQVCTPLVIRTPMGGRRGYGPTHSQTLEKHFLGVPGLCVLAACSLGDPGRLLEQAILETSAPVLFLENKLLYLVPTQSQESLANSESADDFSVSTVTASQMYSSSDVPDPQFCMAGRWPCYLLVIRDAPQANLTIAAYGYMAELARQAALRLAYEYEIFVELIVPTQLAPFALGPILDSAQRTGRLLVAEEGTLSLGWGAEVLAQAAETCNPGLKAVGRLAARDLPVPAAGLLEKVVLPGIDDLMALVVKLTREV